MKSKEAYTGKIAAKIIMLRAVDLFELPNQPFTLDKKNDHRSYLQLSPFIPDSIIPLLPFTHGDYYSIKKVTTDAIRIQITLYGQTKGTKEWNRLHREKRRDKVIIVPPSGISWWDNVSEDGAVTDNSITGDTITSNITGDYLIFLPATVYNLHLENGIRVGSPDKVVLNSSGKNGVLFHDTTNYTARFTYVNGHHVRTNIDNYSEGKKITADLSTDGRPFMIVRSTIDSHLMISLSETCQVNPAVSVPYISAPHVSIPYSNSSMSDSELTASDDQLTVGNLPSNQEIRRTFGLERELVEVSRFTTKQHPLIFQLLREGWSDYTLVIEYTEEGDVYYCYLTNLIKNNDMANSTVLSRFMKQYEMTDIITHPLIMEGRPTGLLLKRIQDQQEFLRFLPTMQVEEEINQLIDLAVNPSSFSFGSLTI